MKNLITMICDMLVVVLVACVFKLIDSDCTKPTRFNLVSNKNDLKNKRNCSLNRIDNLHKIRCMAQCAKRETCYNYQHSQNENLCILCIDTLVKTTGLPQYIETQPSAQGFWEKEDIDDCLSSPCQNDGTCVDKYYQHQCVCGAGFTGQNCQTESQWSSGAHRVQGSLHDLLINFITNSSITVLHSNIPTAYTLSLVNGLFWLPVIANNTIAILSPSTSAKIREINLNNITPVALIQTGYNEVVLASTVGLYVMNLQGSFMYKVCEGNIVDVDNVNQTLVAYIFNNHSIAVVQLISGKWVIQTSFIASQSHADKMNSIQITNDMIYLSSVQRGIIQSYSFDGQYINSFGVSGSTSAGNLLSPFLCGADIQGRILVCDLRNSRLQVLSPGGQWQVFAIQGMLYPYQVFIGSTGIMWEFTWYTDGRKIRKYN